jgi:hypothetical protein
MGGFGFNAPTILFLSTWEEHERRYLRPLFEKLRHAGYTRYVEPCAGAFAMHLVAHDAGYQTENMEGSDVGLFSAICGLMCAGEDLAQLDVRLDGEPVPLEGEPAHQAAVLLYTQLLARMDARPLVDYWIEMRHDLRANRDWHIAAIEERCEKLHARLKGMSYRPLDLWDHLAEVYDDPHAVVSMNPPTYLAGFEKFFNTNGRLTWAEPSYQIFDPTADHHRMVEAAADAKCLLIIQQQAAPKECAHPKPIYARHLSAGQYIYAWSNRPDEIMAFTGGRPMVKPRSMADIGPLDRPVLPPEHEITDRSTVAVVKIPQANAVYYKDLWLHRIQSSNGLGMNFAVLVDGYVAGIAAVDHGPIASPKTVGSSSADSMLMVYALGAPHDTLRLTRLATLMCLQRPIIDQLYGPGGFHASLATNVITVEMTRFPEAKGLRGLMKLERRDKHPDGFKLHYRAELGSMTADEAFATWLSTEAKWRRSTTKGAK